MTELLDSIYLVRPFWLLAIPLPWLLWRLLRSQIRNRLGEFIEPRLWHWVVRQTDGRQSRYYSRLFGAAWLLSMLALSGPYLDKGTPERQPVHAIDIAVIVDISPSMGVRDVTPDRLQRAKFELHDFIERLTGDRIALLAYSASAYRLLPLTSDYPTVRYFIDALDTNLTRQHGSNLTQALVMAGQLLADSKQDGRAIVLLSDGETRDNSSVLQTATRLGAQGIPVYTLGVGTPAGGPVYDARGQFLRHEGTTVISRLDAALLAALAQRSGGIFSPMQGDDSDWNTLLRGIQSLSPGKRHHLTRTQGDYPLFPWLLGIVLLLFLWSGLRRMEGALVMILVLLLPGVPRQSLASPWQEQQAYQALQEQHYERAANIYQSLSGYQAALGQGTAAYRLQQWSQAATAFEKARQQARNDSERARAAYNLGNALVRMERLDEAAQAYREALQWQDNYPRASLNLNLVNRARQRHALAPPADEQATASQASSAQKKKTAGSAYRHDGASPGQDAERKGRPSTTSSLDMTTQHFRLSSSPELAGMIVRLRIGEQDARYGEIMEDRPW